VLKLQVCTSCLATFNFYKSNKSHSNDVTLFDFLWGWGLAIHIFMY
jgi:hypothetical protein